MFLCFRYCHPHPTQSIHSSAATGILSRCVSKHHSFAHNSQFSSLAVNSKFLTFLLSTDLLQPPSTRLLDLLPSHLYSAHTVNCLVIQHSRPKPTPGPLHLPFPFLEILFPQIWHGSLPDLQVSAQMLPSPRGLPCLLYFKLYPQASRPGLFTPLSS